MSKAGGVDASRSKRWGYWLGEMFPAIRFQNPLDAAVARNVWMGL